MRLFWKVFLLLLVTLLITAALSTWLGEIWRTQNRVIDSRISELAALGDTAVGLYEEDGAESLDRWLHHSLRNRHAFGYLSDERGMPLGYGFRRGPGMRPPPPHMMELVGRAMASHQPEQLIDLPRLGVALPVSGEHGNYYWVVATRLTPEEMQRTSSTMRIGQLMIALLTITLLSILLTRMLTRPIRSLQHTSEKLGHGDLSARVERSVAERNDELGELGQTMDRMAHRLDGLVNSHKQLLRDISHELRSPLARLQVALELARNAAGDRAGGELDRIAKETEELDGLIGEVLTLSRFEQGAMVMQTESLQLDEILEEIVADASFEAEAAGKQIDWSGAIPFDMEGDPLWLSRAFDNAIRNAIRYTPEACSVEIAMNVTDEQARISIRDHGNGVPVSALPHLFEPFFRVSDARERPGKHSGYGLGLAIARHAVEQHRGSIEASNHAEGGLVITIALPK